MTRVRLSFASLAEIRDCHGLAVVTLTDDLREKAICVICDKTMKYQIALRTAGVGTNARLWPEVLVSMLGDVADLRGYEVYIYNLVDGEYKTIVQHKQTLAGYPIRLSDAILLSLVAGMDIFIEKSLFDSQGMPFHAASDRLSIPINTLSTSALKVELEKAVEFENYRLASQIQEELKKWK